MAEAQTPADTSKGRMNRRDLYQELNLTKDQQDKIKPIMDKQREEMQAVRNNTALTQEAQREQMGTIRKKYSEQIDVLLNPEQKEKLAKLRKEQQEEMQKRRNGQGGGNN